MGQTDFLHFKRDFDSENMQLLKKKVCSEIWHFTDKDGFNNILTEELIRPSKPQRDFSYPQTENSYALYLEAVSLFDFENTSDQNFKDQYTKWRPFVFGRPVSIGLQIARRNIENDIIWEVNEDLNPKERHHIPYVEVWCQNPIPVDLINSCLVIFPKEEITWEHFDSIPEDFKQVKDLISDVEEMNKSPYPDELEEILLEEYEERNG